MEALKLAVADWSVRCARSRRAYETNPCACSIAKVEVCREITRRAHDADRLCDECAEHFDGLRTHLEALGIAYRSTPHCPRADYYTKTAFEFRHDALGAQDAIGGGGRYDGLVEQCGGRRSRAWLGIGIERALVRAALGIENAAPSRSGSFIVTIGDEAWLPVTGCYTTCACRAYAEIDYRRRSIRAQMRYADAEGFRTR